jgi:hypothetical protein
MPEKGRTEDLGGQARFPASAQCAGPSVDPQTGLPHLLRTGTELAPLSGHYHAIPCRVTIKPRKRLKRDKPDALAVPDAPNVTWSMGNPPKNGCIEN